MTNSLKLETDIELEWSLATGLQTTDFCYFDFQLSFKNISL